MWFKCNKASVWHYVLVLSRVMPSKQRTILWNMTKESNSSVICPWSLGCYKRHVYFIDSMMKWHLINLSTLMNLLNHSVMENVHMMRKSFSCSPNFFPSWKPWWPDPDMSSSCSHLREEVKALLAAHFNQECISWCVITDILLPIISSLRNQRKFLFHFLFNCIWEKHILQWIPNITCSC